MSGGTTSIHALLQQAEEKDRETPHTSSSEYGDYSSHSSNTKKNRRRSQIYEKRESDDESPLNASVDDLTLEFGSNSILQNLEKMLREETDAKRKESLKDLIKKEKVRIKKDRDEQQRRMKESTIRKIKEEKEMQKEAMKKEKEAKKKAKEDALRKIKEEKESKKNKKKSAIPQIVSDCIEYLEVHGLEQVGICRVSGSATQIKLLRSAYEKGKRVELEKLGDPHTVAGLLKIYFRNGEPLLTKQHYEEWIEAADFNMQERVQKFIYLISLLSPASQEILDRLIQFLVKVHRCSAINKMDASNLATMFGPNLLRSGNEQDMEKLLRDTVHVAVVVQTLILEYSTIFQRAGYDLMSSGSSNNTIEATKDKIFRTHIADSAIPRSPSSPSSVTSVSPNNNTANNNLGSSLSQSSDYVPSQEPSTPISPTGSETLGPNSPTPGPDSAPQSPSPSEQRKLERSLSGERKKKARDAATTSRQGDTKERRRDRAQSVSASNTPIVRSWSGLARTLQAPEFDTETLEPKKKEKKAKDPEREERKSRRKSAMFTDTAEIKKLKDGEDASNGEVEPIKLRERERERLEKMERQNRRRSRKIERGASFLNLAGEMGSPESQSESPTSSERRRKEKKEKKDKKETLRPKKEKKKENEMNLSISSELGTSAEVTESATTTDSNQTQGALAEQDNSNQSSSSSIPTTSIQTGDATETTALKSSLKKTTEISENRQPNSDDDADGPPAYHVVAAKLEYPEQSTPPPSYRGTGFRSSVASVQSLKFSKDESDEDEASDGDDLKSINSVGSSVNSSFASVYTTPSAFDPKHANPFKHVPSIPSKSINFLREKALTTDNLFIIPADEQKVKELYAKGDDLDLSQCNDIHLVANLLKMYLSKLEPSLLPFDKDAYDDLISAIEISDKVSRIWFLQELLEESLKDKLRLETLKMLCFLLYDICSNGKSNSLLLGFIFGPLVLKSEQNSEKQAKALAVLIDDCKQLFG